MLYQGMKFLEDGLIAPQGGAPTLDRYANFKTRLDATVPFHSPIQVTLPLHFQEGENAIFTAETVA